MSPKGITSHSYNPCRVQNAVLGTSLGRILICQYPDLKSKELKYRAFDN